MWLLIYQVNGLIVIVIVVVFVMVGHFVIRRKVIQQIRYVILLGDVYFGNVPASQTVIRKNILSQIDELIVTFVSVQNGTA